MTRKHTKRRQHVGLHPLDAIAACQPFPAAEITRILLKVHASFEHLCNGGGDIDHFDRMAAVLNVGLIRCEAIGQEGVDVFKAAQQALMHADELFGRHKRYGFTGPGLEAMKQAISLYEDVLIASSPRQMHDAQMECVRRIQAGQYEQAKESTKQLEANAR